MLHFFRFIVSKVFIVNFLIIVLLLSGGVYAIFNYLDDYTNHGKVLKVPNLINVQYAEINDLLANEENFTVEVTDSVYKKGVRASSVIEQSPRANKEVKRGRKIYVTLAAASAPKITMPNLVDMSIRQASSLMETYGLELGEQIYEPNHCLNCILEQQINGEEVAPGTKVERGSSVDLVIGQGLGNELTPVPFLIDISAEMAKDLLKSKALNLGGLLFDETVLTAEDSLNAKVYRQNPFYSEEPTVRMGTSIDLFLTLDTNKIVFDVKPSYTDSI